MKKMRYLSMILIGLPILWVAYYLLKNPETLAPFINGATMVLLPLILGAFLAKKHRGSWRIFGIGTMTFIVSQLLHIPFNNYLLNPWFENLGLSASSGGTQLMLLGLMLGLSAGLFEEIARYVVYKKWIPEVRGWKQGLMFGAGHGGIEAILLGAIVIYVFLQAVILKDMNTENLILLVGETDLEQTIQFVEGYWKTPWYLSLMGAVERIIAILFHISASLMVLQSVIKNNKWWLMLAITWHTALDAIAVYASQTWGVMTTEGILSIVGVISIWIIWKMLSILPSETPLPEKVPLPKPITADDLSRIN